MAALLSGFFSAIFVMLPKQMLRMAYGEEGLAFRKTCGKTNSLVTFFMNILMFWFVFGCFAVVGARDYERLDATFFMLAPVIIYAIWAVFSRISINKQISKLRNQLLEEKQEEERYRKEGIWKCPYCEKINNATDIICKDCGNYR